MLGIISGKALGEDGLGSEAVFKRISLQLADMERVPSCVQNRENKNNVICLRNLLNPDTALRLLAVFLVTVGCESACQLEKIPGKYPN